MLGIELPLTTPDGSTVSYGRTREVLSESWLEPCVEITQQRLTTRTDSIARRLEVLSQR